MALVKYHLSIVWKIYLLTKNIWDYKIIFSSTSPIFTLSTEDHVNLKSFRVAWFVEIAGNTNTSCNSVNFLAISASYIFYSASTFIQYYEKTTKLIDWYSCKVDHWNMTYWVKYIISNIYIYIWYIYNIYIYIYIYVYTYIYS